VNEPWQKAFGASFAELIGWRRWLTLATIDALLVFRGDRRVGRAGIPHTGTAPSAAEPAGARHRAGRRLAGVARRTLTRDGITDA
jgi:hypothetical protein